MKPAPKIITVQFNSFVYKGSPGRSLTNSKRFIRQQVNMLRQSPARHEMFLDAIEDLRLCTSIRTLGIRKMRRSKERHTRRIRVTTYA